MSDADDKDPPEEGAKRPPRPAPDDEGEEDGDPRPEDDAFWELDDGEDEELGPALDDSDEGADDLDDLPEEEDEDEPFDLDDDEAGDGEDPFDAPLDEEDDELDAPPRGAAGPGVEQAEAAALRAWLGVLARGGAAPPPPRLAGRRLWEEVLFRPAGLFAPPPAEVSTWTLLGASAPRPLRLGVPLWLRASPGEGPRIALDHGAAAAGAAVSWGPGEGRAGSAYTVLAFAPGDALPAEGSLAGAGALELWLRPRRAGEAPGGARDPVGRIPLVASPQDLLRALDRLRERSQGVPVGVRIPLGEVESDLADVLEARPDFVTLVGRGSSIPLLPPPLGEVAVLPIHHGLARARSYLNAHADEVSLIASGGMRLPSDVAVALALGADAVELATVPALTLTGAGEDEEGAVAVQRVVEAYVEQLKHLARHRGRADVHDLCREDLASPLEEVARALKIRTLG